MYILEVSVAVLWDAVKRSEIDLVEWWEKHIKALIGKKRDPKEELKPWQVQSIATDSWNEWDISVLSYAIRNCHDMLNEEHEDLRECAKKLNDMRSDCLCHECRAEIAFDKYIRILQTSMKCYKKLIAEKAAYVKHVKQLENISKYRIRDQETENWMTLLKSRDERMRPGLTEEELRVIHVGLVGKVKESIEEIKQNVMVKQHMEQQQHMQATNITHVTVNISTSEAQTPQTAVQASGTSTPNAVTKVEAKPLCENPAPQSYPVSKLNYYCQMNSVEPPQYDEPQLIGEKFTCTVTFRGESFEGPMRSSKRDAKRAAAQMVIDSLNIN